MSIAERLIHIQQQEGLSASKFADLLGIQRSGLSHIYSGRNKPSIDFLQKLSLHYPQYRLEWILNGDEPIMKNQNKGELSTQRDLFDEIGDNVARSEEIAPYSSKKDKEIIDNSVQTESNSVIDKQTKSIREILYIYTDGTFEILKPVNNK
ncbi:MAG: hypothetical protein C0599_17215 [Salinivirgaceae bacterium]|nr:MAG: hypothetical protein C0599_17215 [Salinivirgaceae bacterium]